MTELVEKASAEYLNAFNAPYDGDEGEADETRHWRGIQAAIAIIVEECAKVAEGFYALYPLEKLPTGDTSDFDKGAQQAIYRIATAIRSLA